jgi:outer membrane protein insertion porin family
VHWRSSIKAGIIAFTILLGIVPGVSAAVEGNIVTAIEVRGNVRVATLTVLAQLRTKVGEERSPVIIRDDIGRLFALGYFRDIEIEELPYKEGRKIIFIVTEKPAIKEINLEGTRALRERTVREILTLKVGDIFSERLLREDVAKIIALYHEKGHHLVEVVTDVREIAGEVVVSFIINEGVAARVREIEIKGNELVSERKIKRVMATRVHRLLQPGMFREDIFNDDLLRIITLYRDEGFLQARIVDTEIRFENEGRLAYITIEVEEGHRFSAGEINVTGNLLFSDEELMGLLALRTNDTFSPAELARDRGRIEGHYAEHGYIFARAEIEAHLNEERKEVNITYHITEGALIHVEKIDIRGNKVTRDDVIRRELTIKPGDIFNRREVERSRLKIHGLGFFYEVNWYTTEGSAPDRKNLIFEVEERKTGTLLFGISYGYFGLGGMVSVSQDNFDITNPPTFTGDGQKIRLEADIGRERTHYELSFTEPWLFDRPMLFGFDIYRATSDWRFYTEGRAGWQLRLGHRLGEFLYGTVAYKHEDITITDVKAGAPPHIIAATFTTNSLILGLVDDQRDMPIHPTSGHRHEITAEIAGGMLGGDVEFNKYTGETRWFFTPFEGLERLVLDLRGRGGFVTDDAPFYERFFLGGVHTVRGYPERGLGPVDGTGEPLGGDEMLIFNAELTYPLVRDIRLAAFLDAGYLRRRGLGSSSGIGIGVGLRVKTPIGPVRLDYGYSIEREEGELYFTIGW